MDCRTVDVIPCTGCASCGLRTPGACSVKDDMQDIFRKMVASDVLVLATPVRFGSYCAELKKVVDRFQPLMVPIYVLRDGEMHFQGRYDLPPLLGVGLVRDGLGPDGAAGAAAAAEEADAFRFLIGRLAVNADTRHAAAAFAGGDEGVARAEIEKAVDAVARRTVVTVLVIDGSRRPKSNTGAIARDLATRLTAAGRAAEVWRVPKWSAGPEATDEALEKLAGADVVVLVAPSYLDELPAVTQRLLEDVWERRAELRGHAPLFYGIAHSGFPEPIQRRAELRSMRFFAEQMGWTWMGGIGFGGTSPIDGRPLDEAGCVLQAAAQGPAARSGRHRRRPAVLAGGDTSLRQVPVPDAAEGADRVDQLAHPQSRAREAA